MNVGILALGGRKSIGTVYYVINLVKALKALPPGERPRMTLVEDSDTEMEEFTEIQQTVDHIERCPHSQRSRFIMRMGPRIAPFLNRIPGALSEARSLQKAVRRQSRDTWAARLRAASVDVLFPCVWSMGRNFGLPWIPWIWDLQHKYYPDLLPAEEVRNRDQRIADMLADAAVVITSSECARRDVERHWPAYAGKIRILHFRSVPDDLSFDRDYREIRRKFDLPDKYLILPNHFSVHKNHRVAFEAIRILRDQSLAAPLVCTGSTTNIRTPRYVDELHRYVETNKLQNLIRILGFIPRDEQVQLMRGAAAIVQPSLFEGWSTLVEDARALGKAIFVSDIPVHREQAVPRAEFFDPQSAESLAARISEKWSGLSPGSSRAEEETSRKEQKTLVNDYARTFMGIANEAVAGSGDRTG